MPTKASATGAMFILGVLFFLFGFVTWLNGSLIPFLKVICELSEFEALFVSFAFYIAYTVMALPMAFVLEKSGYKNGMLLGLGVMAFASLLFIPAAFSGEYLLFLAALFLLATGLTILQSASNPYIVLLGPKESAARRISIMGIINKAAGVAAPILFAFFITLPAQTQEITLQEKEALASELVLPYLVMAFLLLVLIAFVRFSKLPALTLQSRQSQNATQKGLLDSPHLILGALALFFYVGAEVIAGDTIGLYAQSLGLPNATAFTAYTMAFMVLGYLVGIFLIPKYLSQETALLLSALLGMVFSAGILMSSDDAKFVSEFLWGYSTMPLLPDTIVFVALLGLANALVWPTIWPLALDGLGKNIQKGSALLITAIAGGALLPLVFGKMREMGFAFQESYSILFVCYGIIFLYAKFWFKKRSW